MTASGKQYHRDYYLQHREEQLAQARARYAANRVQVLEARKKYREANRDALLAYLAEYRKENGDRIREVVRRWNATPRGRAIARWHTQKRRGLVPAAITPAIIEARFDLFGQRCAYCGSDGSGRVLQGDHLIAVKSGGLTVPENIVPACWRCNLSKGAKEWRAWYRNREFYDPAREAFIDEACS